MRKAFAYACNDNDGLLLSTPIPDATGGLTYTSAVFNGNNFSVGFRVNVTNTDSGTVIHCSQSDSTLNWIIYFNAGNLEWADPVNGVITLATLVAGNYHVWIDVDPDQLDVYWQEEGDSRNFDAFAISEITSVDSMITVGNTYNLDDPLLGTVYDLAYCAAKISSATTYIPGGCNFTWSRYWPMREGTGDTCTDIITGAVLDGSSGITWTGGDTDDPLRWA
jgi:hypothetical protein